ncbi:Crp/Fnr family transcriptional regulator [uncultured Albimonas sp.]|uniref:Crp/Fnr family transcriptional regulator n=1 Tax=uncultured Albimonas sp. TaxID=1331701 RepID=UPI0030EF200E|tara:strand:+ start:1630 stop:2307 length:678 start_codon:yes stop_codon:yes gene_type:complete
MGEETEFLGRLQPEDLQALKARARLRQVARGEVIVAQEEPGLDVYFVLSGRAVAAIYADNGRVVAYRDIGPGAVFGEIAAIDGAPRTASVEAAEAMQVLVLPPAGFRELTATRPGFAWALLEHLAQQMRRMTERVFEYSTMLARERLVAELLRLAELHAPGARQAELRPPPNHFDLASRISTHREAVSREMSRLSSMGLVERADGRLLIADVPRLRAEMPGGREG